MGRTGDVVERPFAAYEGKEPYVFVCYAHADRETVYPELARLHRSGHHIWYDEGITPGSEWSEALARAIEGCAAFLYYVTPNAVASEHCRRELNYALEHGCLIFDVHLVPTDMPRGLKLTLSNRQAIHRYEYSEADYVAKLDRSLNLALAGDAAPGDAADWLPVGDWSLDLDAQTLHRGPDARRLDAKDVAVLLHLVELAPQLVTTDALLNRSWPGVVVGDNVVHRVIARLRKALGDDAREPLYIETRPRQGYRFIGVEAGTPSDAGLADAGRSASTTVSATASANAGSSLRTLGAVLALVLTALVGWYVFTPGTGDRSAQLHGDPTAEGGEQRALDQVTVAVLPLKDLSPDGSIGWLAEGLSHDLSTQIGALTGYVALPRAAVRSTEVGDLPDGVVKALYGYTQTDGSSVRVVIELIDVPSMVTAWSESFRGVLDNPLKLQ